MNATAIVESFVQHPIVEPLGWVLLHFLWQGSFIALVLAIVLVFLRNGSATVRYAVSFSALIAMAACLPITAWITWESQGTPATPRFAFQCHWDSPHHPSAGGIHSETYFVGLVIYRIPKFDHGNRCPNLSKHCSTYCRSSLDDGCAALVISTVDWMGIGFSHDSKPSIECCQSSCDGKFEETKRASRHPPVRRLGLLEARVSALRCGHIQTHHSPFHFRWHRV